MFCISVDSTVLKTAASVVISLNLNELWAESISWRVHGSCGGDHTPVRFSTIGDPHLLPVHNILITHLHSSGLDAGDIRTCPWLCDTVGLVRTNRRSTNKQEVNQSDRTLPRAGEAGVSAQQ